LEPTIGPAEIRLGRRALDGVTGVEIRGPLSFEAADDCWSFPVRLTIAESSPHVTCDTDWYVLVESDYPTGRVSIRPAQNGGLHATFRHMERNVAVGRPWRSGAPCLDRPGRWLGSRDLVNQPTSAAERMRWRVERALEWLQAAALDRLTGENEPFELPYFPGKAPTIGFDEDPQRFAIWATTLGRAGTASVKRINDSLAVAYAFFLRDEFVTPPRWGKYLRDNDKIERAFWMTLRDLPVRSPWDVPSTWGELRAIAHVQKVDLDGHLRWIYHHLHDKNTKGETYLLLGFPIPEIYDGPGVRMHWQPMMLPAPIDALLTAVHVRKGRKASAGAWTLERVQHFGDDKPIAWLRSDPWAEDRLRVRGVLSKELCAARVVVLGAGALGSALAELLLRAGVYNILTCDGETVEIGNLRRHTLTMADVPHEKSLMLALHLNGCSPFANVEWTYSFPNRLGVERDRVRRADVVIDCTASDDVAARLGTFDWDEGSRWFFSGSLGVDARRLFCFAHYGATFPTQGFFDTLRPYIAQERKLLQERDPLTLHGAGCWNPVFPARWDDVMALAACMLRIMDAAVASGTCGAPLRVIDRSM
jgi:hypothetical protein